MNIILFGPPGSGKGTQADLICEKYNLLHISTGDLLRSEIKSKSDFGKGIQEIIDSGNLVSDEIIIKLINSAIKKDNDFSGYLFDGFPRNMDQVSLLSKLLKSKDIKIDCVLFLNVDKSILLDRVLHRKEAEGRSDDNEKTFKNRFDVYCKETQPLLQYYKSDNLLREINGIGEIYQINQRINAELETF